MDLTGMSGLEVLEKVRSDERTEPLPIILCSAPTRHGDAIEGYKFGANSYVTKPASFTEFSPRRCAFSAGTGLTRIGPHSRFDLVLRLWGSSARRLGA